MTVVRRFVSGIVASIVLLPSLAFASPDAELSLVQKLLASSFPPSSSSTRTSPMAIAAIPGAFCAPRSR